MKNKILLIQTFTLAIGLSVVALLGFACQSKPDNNNLSVQGTSVPPESEKNITRLPKREQMLSALKNDHFDVLVIGGGATGSGAALDAATRGLKTALIEAHDFSFGTSSRSTKLVHGGVRYLENAVKKLDRQEYALVRDALKERKRFLDNAPNLTNALPILTPVYGWFEALYFWAGLKLYDLVAGKASLGPSEFISRSEAIMRFPMLKKEGLKGAVVYFDGQFDDARMNVALILSAIREGAVALNYVRADGLIREDSRIRGAMVRDAITNESWPVKATVVINATGPFADKIRHMDNPKAPSIMVPSQGSHILLPESFSPPENGLIIPKTKDGRVLFLLPWMGKTLAGTTDQMEKITDEPRATNNEVEYILEHLRLYFDVPVTRKDVLASWSGLRPLAKPENMAGTTASISRDHLIEISPSHLITIVGGKWTTYRKMAEDVVDAAIKDARLQPLHNSTTKDLKLVGARHYKKGELPNLHGLKLDTDIIENLSRAYGDRAEDVISFCLKSPHLAKRLVEGYPYIAAEVPHAVHFEYAEHATDVLARRTRLAFLDNQAALKALPQIVGLMAGELAWDQARKLAELKRGLEFLSTMLTVPPA